MFNFNKSNKTFSYADADFAPACSSARFNNSIIIAALCAVIFYVVLIADIINLSVLSILKMLKSKRSIKGFAI